MICIQVNIIQKKNKNKKKFQILIDKNVKVMEYIKNLLDQPNYICGSIILMNQKKNNKKKIDMARQNIRIKIKKI